MRLVIISGRSGSGKSICLEVLEDSGFYCIDNLPLKLLLQITEELNKDYENVAVSIDARTKAQFGTFSNIVNELKSRDIHCEIMYLDAANETLIKRFSSTRRKHPLSNSETSLAEALDYETKLLSSVSELANFRVETDNFTVHHFRDLLRHRILNKPTKLTVLFQSFSYKIGIPSDSDFVFDARCLPNPYWEIGLRDLTGLDKIVKDFFDNQTIVQALIKDIATFLQTWMVEFKNNDRTYLTISIGCTGGQHRSVYLTEALAQRFQNTIDEVQVRHKELKR